MFAQIEQPIVDLVEGVHQQNQRDAHRDVGGRGSDVAASAAMSRCWQLRRGDERRAAHVSIALLFAAEFVYGGV